MKKISKLGLISVLCLVLVIGGVFATWSYGTEKATDATGTMGLSLTDVTETKRGTLVVTSKPTLTIDDTNGDYVAELVITGDLVITFTADEHSEDDIIANGIDLQISFTVPYGEYNSITIITCATIDLEQGDAAHSGSVHTYTIPKATLESKLTLGNISLPTYDDYTALKALLDGKNITITVKDVTA